MGKFTKEIVIRHYKATNIGTQIVTVFNLNGERFELKQGMECIVDKKPFSTKLMVEEISEKPIEKNEKIIGKKKEIKKKVK